MNLTLRTISLAFAVGVPGIAMAEPDRSHLKDLTVDSLKSIYLACNDGVLDGRLSTGAVAQCSVVYEELKQRAFDGDFDRLLAWSRSQPDTARARRAANGL
jgi:hypothetical protein